MEKHRTTLLLIIPPQLGLLNGFAAGLISFANYVSARQPEVCVEIIDLSAQSLRYRIGTHVLPLSTTPLQGQPIYAKESRDWGKRGKE